MSTLPVAVTYRTATTDDLDAIMALEPASFVADAWSRDMMGDEVESVHNAYSVALIGDALAAPSTVVGGETR